MNAYQYQAAAQNGIETSGIIEANNEVEVARLLQQRKLVPLTIEISKEKQGGLFSWMRITAADRIMLMRQLAMLTRSGITIPSAIPEISSTTYKNGVRRALENVQQDIQSGIPLSEAMKAQPKLFNSAVCGIISSAEQTGELAPAFERLAHMLKFKQEISRKLMTSFLYPSIVFIVTILVTYALFFNFIPKLAKFLSSMGKPLPRFTQDVFDFAAFLKGNIVWILGAAALVLLCLFITFQTQKGRRLIESIFIKIPIFGTILVFAEVSNISTTLRSMMDSGASLISSLPLLRDSMATYIYRDWIDVMREQLMQGTTLQACMHKKLIPSAARSVIKTGEMSGSLPDAFAELETYYGALLQHKINLLVSLINPLLIIVIGSIVATVYIAIILAIVSIN